MSSGGIDNNGFLKFVARLVVLVGEIRSPCNLFAHRHAVGIDREIFIAPIGPSCIGIGIRANIVLPLAKSITEMDYRPRRGTLDDAYMRVAVFLVGHWLTVAPVRA